MINSTTRNKITDEIYLYIKNKINNLFYVPNNVMSLMFIDNILIKLLVMNGNYLIDSIDDNVFKSKEQLINHRLKIIEELTIETKIKKDNKNDA